MMPMWVREAAALFWAEAGGSEPFPRTLKDSLLGAFDVGIKEIANLSIHKVENRLAHLGTPCPSGESDRPLRACLAASGTAAWIFLDAGDDPDEKTASLAHEIAHFLRHFLSPRRRAVRALGEGIAAVLDGQRDPTPAERLRAILDGVPLAVHVHYLRREAFGPAGAERVAEDEADWLAWELLAPADEVRKRMGDNSDRESLQSLLARDFGLAPTMARAYAGWLLPDAEESPAVRRLGNLLNGCRDRGTSWE
jgi:hypothetical protein